MASVLTDGTLYGNNEIIAYMPNSASYDVGNAERKVEPQVVGGGLVENVVTEDFTTAKSMLKFDLKTTDENEERLLGWIEKFDENVFRFVSSSGKTRIFQSAVVINKSEINTGSDGVISVEIESAPAVIA